MLAFKGKPQSAFLTLKWHSPQLTMIFSFNCKFFPTLCLLFSSLWNAFSQTLQELMTPTHTSSLNLNVISLIRAPFTTFCNSLLYYSSHFLHSGLYFIITFLFYWLNSLNIIRWLSIRPRNSPTGRKQWVPCIQTILINIGITLLSHEAKILVTNMNMS